MNAAVPIVECDQFALSRWDLSSPGRIGGDGHCHLICVLDGAVSVEGDPAAVPLPHGRTMLLPASLPPAAFDPHDGWYYRYYLLCDLKGAVKLEAVDYLCKPVSIREVADTIARALQK